MSTRSFGRLLMASYCNADVYMYVMNTRVKFRGFCSTTKISTITVLVNSWFDL